MSMTDVNFNPITEDESESLWDDCLKYAENKIIQSRPISLLQALVEENPDVEKLIIATFLTKNTKAYYTLRAVYKIREKILSSEYAKDLVELEARKRYNSERFWR